MRIVAIVVASLAMIGALPLVAILGWIGVESIGHDAPLALVFLMIAMVHLLFTATALVLGTREHVGFSIASLVMAAISGVFTLTCFVVGPAILFGLSGA